MNPAQNKFLFDHDQFEKVDEIILNLKKENLIANGAGFCWAMSDLLYQRLLEQGISCRLVECECIIQSENPRQITTVGGHDVPDLPNQVATHVVVLTEHEQPLLIDCSIKHVLPDPWEYVCTITSITGDILSTVKRGDLTITYRQKQGQQFPKLHQDSIVNRIKSDLQLKRYMKFFRIASIIMILIIATEAYFMVSNRIMIENNSVRHLRNKELIQFLERRIDEQQREIDNLKRH